MAQKQNAIPLSQLEELHTSGAGYDILRYIGLPEILGAESPALLYFLGRNLARKFQIEQLEDIYYLFDQMGWGKIELVKEKRKEMTFHLLADSVVRRLSSSSFQADFRMEAGFLAEAVHMLKGTECECAEEINQKIHQVEFTVVCAT
ncbi:DUF2507 domain-containing protein [Virgibacillus xinjiangensis]|uniref:DUF2507 domain-containing protein n=1 Tax=Virgibacillus xinjiangensis TaxID=393090 RepID=A0ABV7CUV3_9BACI